MKETEAVGVSKVLPEVPGAPGLVETGASGELVIQPLGDDLEVPHRGDDLVTHHRGDDLVTHHLGDDLVTHHPGDDPEVVGEIEETRVPAGQQCCGCRRSGRDSPPRWLARELCPQWPHSGWSGESVRLAPGSGASYLRRCIWSIGGLASPAPDP